MDVFEVMKWRRSVREFAPRKVEREKILQILEMARIAPSSSNRQAWHFVVVDEPALIEQIPKQVALGGTIAVTWLRNAPCVVVGCYTKALTHYAAELFDHKNYLVDVSIAMTHICLAATALGIGSCFIGWFNTRKLKKLLALPGKYKIAVLLALGYPANESSDKGIGNVSPRQRKKLHEVLSFNRYGKGLEEKKTE